MSKNRFEAFTLLAANRHSRKLYGAGSSKPAPYIKKTHNLLCVHEIVMDELFDAVADGVHATRVFHRIAALELLGDTFDLGVLPHQRVIGTN